MHKLFILIPIALAACGHRSDVAESTETSEALTETVSSVSSIPTGFTVVERSTDGYFIRLASAERASSATIRTLGAALSGPFDRIDLCLDAAHERGDEYLSIIGGMVYDYEYDLIYPLNTM